MKTITKLIATAGLAAAAIVPTAATAQVEGKVATASVSRALRGVTSLMQALQSVSTTYAAQLQTAQTKQTELQNLVKAYDTNNDGNLDQAENAALQNAPNKAQIQALQEEVAAIDRQIQAANIYAVEQVLAQYPVTLREIATAQKIVMVVDPSSLQFAGQGLDITEQVATGLNGKNIVVGVVPPQGWRARPESVQIWQELERRLVRESIIAQRQQQQQQQQQQQGNAEAPAGR